MKSRIMLAIAAVMLSMLAVPSALAQATQVRMPVSFTLTGCATFPAGLTVYGSGEAFIVINTRIDDAGVAHIQFDDLVTGTATDSNGARYVFNYHTHVSRNVPPGGFPSQITIGVDHFNLVGDGQASQVQVHFVATATFTSPTTSTIDFINVHGSPFTCDPI